LSGHARLAPHVPVQAQLRPGGSALRFSSAGLRQSLTGSALSLLADRPEVAMAPSRDGAAGLTARLDVRVSPAEKVHLRAIAHDAGMSVADLVRRRSLGRPVVSRTDATTVRELRRLGGLLKKVHVDSGGAYSEATAAALKTLASAIAAIADGR
jgi:hypothetical protein